MGDAVIPQKCGRSAIKFVLYSRTLPNARGYCRTRPVRQPAYDSSVHLNTSLTFPARPRPLPHGSSLYAHHTHALGHAYGMRVAISEYLPQVFRHFGKGGRVVRRIAEGR